MKLYLSLRFAIVLSCLTACCAMAADSPKPTPVPDLALNAYTKPQQLVVLPDGRKIHLFCAGEGSPTVIFTAGMGGWAADWYKVQGTIALKTRTCAWDRAGHGYSDASPWPQDIRRTTDDLESALKAAKIDGPYLMVGHSMGGYESLLFTDRHSGQVVGMVLVDPSFPDQNRRFKVVAPKFSIASEKFSRKEILDTKTCVAKLKSGVLTLTSADPDKCFDYRPTYPLELKNAMMQMDIEPGRWLNNASELSQFNKSSMEIINKKRNFGSMPLRVLTAGDVGELPPSFGAAEVPAFQAEWLRGHDAIAALSTNGTNVVVPGATHYIHFIKPEVVISAISQMVDEIQLKAKLAEKQN